MTRIVLFTLVLGIWLPYFLVAEEPPRKLELHAVPTSIKSYQLLAMSMDSDGFI